MLSGHFYMIGSRQELSINARPMQWLFAKLAHSTRCATAALTAAQFPHDLRLRPRRQLRFLPE